MTQHSEKNMQLLNPDAVGIYVGGIIAARGKEQDARRTPTTGELEKAEIVIAGIVLERAACFRAATAGEIAACDSNGALELQGQLFGRTFKTFAPEQDAHIEEFIRDLAAKELKLGEPRESARPHASPSGSSLTRIFNNANAAPAIAEPDAARRIELLADRDSCVRAARALGVPFDESPGWNENNRFYKVLGGQEELRGYFYAERTQGEETLRRCRLSPGILPDSEICGHIGRFARGQGMTLSPNTGDTGLFSPGPAHLVLELQSLPPDFSSNEPLTISGVNNRFTFVNLNAINAPASSETLIAHCPNFTSLGDLEFSRGSLRIENCENFQSLGNLRQVGMDGDAEKASLAIVNCPRLVHFGCLRKVHGDLDLRGSGIRKANFPAAFDFIKGRVYLDEGVFVYRKGFWRSSLKPLAGGTPGPGAP
jgi:hypothetical protein